VDETNILNPAILLFSPFADATYESWTLDYFPNVVLMGAKRFYRVASQRP
jgi:hypothetical protein